MPPDPDYDVLNAIISAYQSEEFVRDRVSKYFEVLSYTWPEPGHNASGRWFVLTCGLWV